jgi:hypothetical protein
LLPGWKRVRWVRCFQGCASDLRHLRRSYPAFVRSAMRCGQLRCFSSQPCLPMQRQLCSRCPSSLFLQVFCRLPGSCAFCSSPRRLCCCSVFSPYDTLKIDVLLTGTCRCRNRTAIGVSPPWGRQFRPRCRRSRFPGFCTTLSHSFAYFVFSSGSCRDVRKLFGSKPTCFIIKKELIEIILINLKAAGLHAWLTQCWTRCCRGPSTRRKLRIGCLSALCYKFRLLQTRCSPSLPKTTTFANMCRIWPSPAR